jgi:hypothetical protein
LVTTKERCEERTADRTTEANPEIGECDGTTNVIPDETANGVDHGPSVVNPDGIDGSNEVNPDGILDGITDGMDSFPGESVDGVDGITDGMDSFPGESVDGVNGTTITNPGGLVDASTV